MWNISLLSLLPEAWSALDRRSVIWKSDLSDKIKRNFFRVADVSILLYGCITWARQSVLKKCLTAIAQECYELRVVFIKFPDFFVMPFKIVLHSWKFSMLLLYLLWDDWPIFMISGSNEQLQQQLEYTLLKPDCHSRWILKIQSGRADTLEERYAIKFCFTLGKNTTETYGMLETAWIEHQFLSGIRDSCKQGDCEGWLQEWEE